VNGRHGRTGLKREATQGQLRNVVAPFDGGFDVEDVLASLSRSSRPRGWAPQYC
jgi:hypothetical protein